MSGPDSADELRRRAASLPLGRFGGAGLRRRGLMMEPALERRLIAFPEAQEYANNGHRNGVVRSICAAKS
jgi:hypothetical protein